MRACVVCVICVDGRGVDDASADGRRDGPTRRGGRGRDSTRAGVATCGSRRDECWCEVYKDRFYHGATDW